MHTAIQTIYIFHLFYVIYLHCCDFLKVCGHSTCGQSGVLYVLTKLTFIAPYGRVSYFVAPAFLTLLSRNSAPYVTFFRPGHEIVRG